MRMAKSVTMPTTRNRSPQTSAYCITHGHRVTKKNTQALVKTKLCSCKEEKTQQDQHLWGALVSHDKQTAPKGDVLHAAHLIMLVKASFFFSWGRKSGKADIGAIRHTHLCTADKFAV